MIAGDFTFEAFTVEPDDGPTLGRRKLKELRVICWIVPSSGMTGVSMVSILRGYIATHL